MSRLWQVFLEQRERWFLWSPVLVAVGIGLYFLAPSEPPWWGGLLALGFAVGGAALGRNREAVFVVGLCLVLATLGFTAAQIRNFSVAAPVLAKKTGVLSVTGRIVTLERGKASGRVVLEEVTIPGIAEVPDRIRVRLNRPDPSLLPGEMVKMRAVLMPPPEPTAPDAFSFSRHVWFLGIGGVGFAVSPAERVEGEDVLATASLIERLRSRVTGRIVEVLGLETGAVAAALVTGEVGGISEPLMEAYRASGLAHLLSISGLHMSLAAGLVFVGVRGLLALIPPIALRYDIKKATAFIALGAMTFYLLLSGAGVPTQRAYLMTAVVLLAVMVDRAAISQRLVAWAALLILLIRPEALVGPSFQMSFAAVVALVATYEVLARPLRRWRVEGEDSWWRGAGLYLSGVLLTTVVASVATAPFAVYHFHRFSLYSLAANLLAVPLTGLWVMPWAIAALLLMPLGWDGPALEAMGWGVEIVNRTAQAVAAWPHASLGVSAFSVAVPIIFALGGLWFCLWQGRGRLWGLVAVPLGLLIAALATPPDILVGSSGRSVAARGDDGELRLIRGRAESFTETAWAEAEGQERLPPWEGQLSCDALGCLFEVKKKKVALVVQAEALEEDCAMADILISQIPIRGACGGSNVGAPVVIDRFDLWRGGAHAFRLEGKKISILTAAQVMGQRPWTPLRWQMKGKPKAKSGGVIIPEEGSGAAE